MCWVHRAPGAHRFMAGQQGVRTPQARPAISRTSGNRHHQLRQAVISCARLSHDSAPYHPRLHTYISRTCLLRPATQPLRPATSAGAESSIGCTAASGGVQAEARACAARQERQARSRRHGARSGGHSRAAWISAGDTWVTGGPAHATIGVCVHSKLQR